MARSISFRVEGPVDTRITIDELDDGTLRFNLEVLGAGLLGDLRGFFFDLVGLDSSGAGLSVVGIDGSEDVIGKQVFEEGGVDRVSRDVNVKGAVARQQGKFDVGIEFGTSGIGKDDVSDVSFILSADSGVGLSLDNLDLADLALRYTSVGDESEREGSEKIAGQSSGIARNDEWEVDENAEETTDLLANDSNGVQADGSRKTVISVTDAQGDFTEVEGGFERTVVIDGLTLGTIFVSHDGYATFTADGEDVDKLAHDDIRTWNFTYETRATNGSLAAADVVLTIDGQNDQPEVSDVALTIGEDAGFADVNEKYAPLEGSGVTGNFIGTDIDQGDLLTFEILTDPVDAFGNQYGSVVNNGGSFTFNPGDQFQFLEAGETRDVTFTYRAVDDSEVGSGNALTEETDTSAPATVTITVEGADDALVNFEEQLTFITQDQSMWGTGDAIVLEPDLGFWGIDTGPHSLGATLIAQQSFDTGGVGDVFDEIASWFTGKDDNIPDAITTPGLSTDGSFAAKIGLQPYFSLTSGDVDSEIPVDIYFDIPRQLEHGGSFEIQSGYSVDGGATFNTMSPNVEFGMDFVFDLDTDLDVNITSSSFGSGTTLDIWDVDTGNISGFKGELGEPGFNLFDFNAADDLAIPNIDLGGIANLGLEYPVIETEGAPSSNPNILEADGVAEDFVDLTVDVDAVVTKLIQAATGVTIPFGGDGGLPMEAFGVNLLSFEYDWDVVAVDFITTLDLLQSFALEVQQLPLVMTLEDGSEIDDIFMGDVIEVDVPDDSLFDADVDGDGDGLIDFVLDVDMDAIFSNLTELGLGMELFTGLLSFNAGITSDLFNDISVSLFGDGSSGLIDTLDGNDDGFLVAETTELLDEVIATPFDATFDLIGWNTPSTTANDWFFDVA